MKTVVDILSEHQCPACTIESDQDVYQALNLMAEKDVGALLVLRKGQVVGIFSERDFIRKVELKGLKSKAIKVEEVMSQKVICVRPESSAEECLELMHANKIRHLPVITRSGELLAFLSILDVVQALLQEKMLVISKLESYVSQHWPF